MRRHLHTGWLFLVALTLLLPACYPATADSYWSGAPDPYAAAGDARATLIAVEGRERAALAAATVKAAETAGALDAYATRLAAESQATAQAYELAILRDSATQSALDREAERTQAAAASAAAAAATATAVELTATPLAVTQAAMFRLATQDAAAYQDRVELAAIQKRNAQVWATALPVLTLLGLLLSVLIAVSLGRSLWAWWAEKELLKSSLVETRIGTVVVRLDDYGRPEAYLVDRPLVVHNHQLGRGVQKAPMPAPSLRAAPSLQLPSHLQYTSPTSERHRVLALLDAAIDQAGADATKLPGWRDLGMSSQSWQAAVAALKAQLLLRADHTGTYVAGQAQNLGWIKYQVETGSLRIPPP